VIGTTDVSDSMIFAFNSLFIRSAVRWFEREKILPSKFSVYDFSRISFLP